MITIGGLSVGLLQEGLAGRTTLRRHEANERALEIAEAGLVKAEMEILALTDAGADGVGTYSGTYAGGTVAVTAEVDATAPDHWVLTAKATYGLSTRTLEVEVRRSTPILFTGAAFGRDGVTISASTTDAFDSRLGTYASQATNVDAKGPYAQLGGGVGSNRGITLTGNTLIRGDAVAGPGYTTVGGIAKVTGSITPLTAPAVLPYTPIAEFQAAMASPSNGTWTQQGGTLTYSATTRKLSVSGGGVLTLDAGTYFVTDLTLAGNSVLKLNGNVKLYATGKVDLSGGTLINTTGIAAGFQIYSHPYTSLVPSYVPSLTSLKLTGGSASILMSYGPESPLTLTGGGHIYGGFIAKTVSNTGGSFLHYDKALGDFGAATVVLSRVYWREPSLPVR